MRLPVGISVGFPIVLAVAVGIATRRRRRKRQDSINSAYEKLIGKTPLVKLERLSQLVGRSIYVKMESLNPGGTGKDRASLHMIQHAEATGQLPQPIQQSTSYKFDAPKNAPLESVIVSAMKHSRTGGLVVEGTSGSTGISLATLCAARGHACLVVLPDDQASEKQAILGALGGTFYLTRNCAISNSNHYVNVARRLATLAQSKYGIKACFINQFENKANFEVHYNTTGPEILRACPQIKAFVMSSGTGGTIAGVGMYLKQHVRSCQVVLVDPPGSVLYHRIQDGVAYAPQQEERSLKRHRYDTLAEGIGLDRLTCNFNLGVDAIDCAIRVSDQEAVDMAHFLLKEEGLWVGSSSAMNVVGAIRTAVTLKEGSTVVTIICDAGSRHVTRFWNADFIREWGLEWPGDDDALRIPDCLKDYYKPS